jgi:hypothetical protein
LVAALEAASVREAAALEAAAAQVAAAATQREVAISALMNFAKLSRAEAEKALDTTQ